MSDSNSARKLTKENMEVFSLLRKSWNVWSIVICNPQLCSPDFVLKGFGGVLLLVSHLCRVIDTFQQGGI